MFRPIKRLAAQKNSNAAFNQLFTSSNCISGQADTEVAKEPCCGACVWTKIIKNPI